MYEKETELLIIGNGFDIAHGLKTRYSDFRSYVMSDDSVANHRFFPPLIVVDEVRTPYGKEMQRIFDKECGNDWSDFENHLGKLSYQILPHAKCNPLNERFLQDDIYNFYRFVRYDLREIFDDWIRHIDYSHFSKNSRIDSALRDIDFVLSFNYTDVLERKYNFEGNKVFHVHGKVGGQLIFGHGKSEDELLTGKAGIEFDFQETVLYLRKPVEEIIGKNEQFFRGLTHVRKIYCCGFSFSDVDKPYITEICKYLNNDVVWYQDDYDLDNQLTKKIRTIKSCGFKGRIEKYKFF